MMNIIDIHSHKKEEKRLDTIYNLSFPSIQDYNTELNFSVGIHPWNIPTEIDWNFFRKVSNKKNILAIGEIGIDNLKSNNAIPQADVFYKQLLIAEEVKKPVIIHMVKSLEEIIKIYKLIKPKQPWIIHGFRGKPEQANQLIRLGFILSFGEKYNYKTINSITNILAESDNSDLDIETILSNIAIDKNIEIKKLINEIESNTKRIFF